LEGPRGGGAQQVGGSETNQDVFVDKPPGQEEKKKKFEELERERTSHFIYVEKGGEAGERVVGSREIGGGGASLEPKTFRGKER